MPNIRPQMDAIVIGKEANIKDMSDPAMPPTNPPVIVINIEVCSRSTATDARMS